MRLYLKLALIIAAAALMQSSVRSAGRCAWEIQFAARCWAAYHLQDMQLQAQLVEEGQQQLVADVRRAGEAEALVARVNAAGGG